MLKLVTMQRGGEKEFFVEWEIGQPAPIVPRGHILHGLTATGKEFHFVARMFPAWAPIGQVSGYWHGDLAKTIIGCLRMKEDEVRVEQEVSERGG